MKTVEPKNEEYDELYGKINEYSINNIVVIVFANNAYYDVVKNWLYSITKLKINNYLVVATDDELYKKLYDDNIHVYKMLCDNELGELWIQRTKLITAVIDGGLATSKREAREFIESGAVSIDGEKITDPEQNIEGESGSLKILKRGKKNLTVLQFK